VTRQWTSGCRGGCGGDACGRGPEGEVSGTPGREGGESRVGIAAAGIA